MITKKLSKDMSACNNYQQDLQLCNSCLRNIGFYHPTHRVWSDFKLEVNKDFTVSCNGYIESEQK